jgi:hypothetical protein
MIMEFHPGRCRPGGCRDGRTRPAAQAQHGGHHSRGLAPAIAQVKSAEPERHNALDRVRVVAALVAPLLVGWVRRGSVEFHAYPVLLVQVVEVPVAGALSDIRLPESGGQPVRAFHPADVAILEDGQSPSPASPSATASSRRQRIFFRASMA